MIETLLSLIGAAPPPRAGTPGDARLAMAALMVRLARADRVYDAREIAAIDAALAARYGLDADAAASLRRQAEEIEAGAADTVRFTRAIKDAVPYEERYAEVVALWRIALADEKRSAEEDGLMRLIVNLLGVSDRDSAIARREAAGE
ncbi:MAG: TerB family tellurite resistance protein [Alphaproteobacteria bacterium]|nr:MAG: TerB family tellurite resistance protein [Alphaproteobacteria bacterium]